MNPIPGESEQTTISSLDADAWQESWDRQQEAYLPDREERFAAMMDTVAAVTGDRPPRVLDLAGGTGSISLRLLRRFPAGRTTLLDLDPVTLAIATASLDDRSAIVTTDLRRTDWVTALPHDGYDAVLAATALHWFTADRLAALYREIRTVLRPGGVFVNADHIPDDGLPELSERFGARAAARRDARHAAAAVPSWTDWWRHVSADPALGPLAGERERLFGGEHSAEWMPPVSWHVETLFTAGYSEVGLVWRGTTDAAVAAVN